MEGEGWVSKVEESAQEKPLGSWLYENLICLDKLAVDHRGQKGDEVLVQWFQKLNYANIVH